MQRAPDAMDCGAECSIRHQVGWRTNPEAICIDMQRVLLARSLNEHCQAAGRLPLHAHRRLTSGVWGRMQCQAASQATYRSSPATGSHGFRKHTREAPDAWTMCAGHPMALVPGRA